MSVYPSLMCNQDRDSREANSLMLVLERIRARAASAPKHIVLPEGEDERTIRAASLCLQERLARLTLVGAEDVIPERASKIGAGLTGGSILGHRRSAHRGPHAPREPAAARGQGATPG